MSNNLTDGEIEQLKYLAEVCISDAMMNLIEANGQIGHERTITLAVADNNVKRANAIHQALKYLGVKGVDARWEIVNNRVRQIS
jgi:uncharacterized protein YfeS